jgi:acetolactate synthase-1/2/3 large subunit
MASTATKTEQTGNKTVGEKFNGGRLFAKALKKEGVKQICVLAGGHIMSIFYGCRAEGIKVVDFRHECAAGYAADAYARVSGQPGVLVTTAGPGVVDTCTAMSEALVQGSPVIHIGGASPSIEAETGALQDINTLEIMSTVTKWARKIQTVERIPEYVSMAFRHATAGTPGPVYLEICQDILETEVENPEAVLYPEKYRTEAQPFGDPALIDKAADLLVNAKAPAMVIGDDARFSSQYGESVRELVDYLKIPVMVQVVSRGVFADEDTNPLFKMGAAITQADVVIELVVNNCYQVGKMRPPIVLPSAKLIQVNPDATRIGYNAPAEVGIIGGAGAVAKQILEAVKSKRKKQEDLTWFNKASAIAKGAAARYVEGFTSNALPIHPGRCAFEVSKFLSTKGKDWSVVCDGGDAAQWMKAAANARCPGQVITFGPNGTIGTGIGFTVGTWLARNKPVLYYVGDGSFGFYSMEFDTLAKQGIPVVCVISNDSSWGMIKLSENFIHPEEVKANGHCATTLAQMRAYEKMPAVWGGYGERVTKPEDIIPAIERAVANGKPSIINVEVDQVNMSPVTRGFGESLKKK